MLDAFKETPHKRWNPLVREWVLVSPHRLQRPWQGKVEEVAGDNRPAHDPKCYLCPGNERANGARNPDYKHTFVFDNDFMALLPGAAPAEYNSPSSIIRARVERGLCRVICFSPRHDLTLARMDAPAIRLVVDTWGEQYQELGARREVRWVQVFENKGAIMGCSNPHPHGQVWATESLPNEAHKEDASQLEFFEAHQRARLDDYLSFEDSANERIVCSNEHWCAVVPFWAKWPFETMILTRTGARSLADLDDAARDSLASILRELTARQDNLFLTSFPYTMGIHQAPTDGEPNDHWRLHFHFYPPLLRSATVQKFMVGFEMLAMPQRDITAESAAGRLRALSPTHHKQESPR